LPICPKCGETIDHLIAVKEVFTREECKVYAGEEEGILDFRETLSREYLDDEVVGFRCPVCKELLFKSWDEAWKFLRE